MSSSEFTLKTNKKFSSILLFGPPGSGKGTMGHLLSGGGKHYHLSSGDIFRSMSPNSPAGQLQKEYMDKGLLLPSSVAIDIWKYYVDGLVATNRYFPSEQYLLLDGMPRTPEQAVILDTHVHVHHVISLEIPNEQALFERLRGRAKKEGRADDMKDEVLATRMKVYKEETETMLNHYSSDIIHRINAQQGIYEVLRDILQVLAPTLSHSPLDLAHHAK